MLTTRSPGPAAALCAALLAILAAPAQPGTPSGANSAATLEDAQQKLQDGQVRSALRLLERLTAREPGNARAWRALGGAALQRREYRRAIRAWQRAAAIEPDSPQVFYSLGSAYAAAHDAASAWQWLARARATHRYDMTQAAVDEHLATLRSDPRFAALLPQPSEFAAPFVERVRIIREWRGENPNDQFGWIARNIGDVDGDGVNDIVTSAPTHGAEGAGRIYVYSTGRDRLLWSADGAPGDQLGTGLEAAGDTNHDGIPDVIASGPAGRGIARIYSGRDGLVLHEFRAPRRDESFGSHAAGVGDQDGDGCADVMVGSPGRDARSPTPGHAYVYSGRSGGLILTLSGERDGDQFGSTVAGYAGAREQYLVVGAPRAGPDRHGRVYVYAGSAHELRFTIDADATGRALGLMFVSVPGDLDGDGVPDVYASDWSNAALGPSTGRVYVHSGRSGERLLVLTGEHSGDGFGTSPSAAGDVDGDGHADLIVGAWQYGQVALSAGRAYLYSGRDGRLLRTYTDRVPGDTLGFDAVGLGDVDGDGTMDLLLTAAWSGANGYHSGRVFVVSSGVAPAGASAGASRAVPRRGLVPY